MAVLLSMCGGIQYQDHKIYFPQSGAKLPVRFRSGDVSWITWGKRKEENDSQFPNGGWARLDSIKLSKWKPRHPRPVLIPAAFFMEKDHDRQSHWMDLSSDQAIQGLLAERDGEQRIYVVTEETPPEYHWIHDRWPCVIRISDSEPSIDN